MKRGLVLGLTLALALSLLAGCEMFVPAPTERPSNWWNSAEPAGSADPSQSQAVWQEGVGTDFDRRFYYDEMCATGDTVYFKSFSSDLIYYADKATGICLPLCGKPECTHSGETCNAYAAGLYGLANYNGRLYWVGRVYTDGKSRDFIFSMAYDGTGRRTVRELTDWTPPLPYSGSLVQAVFHRGYIYKCFTSDELVDGEAKTIARVKAYSIEDDREAFDILSEEVALNHSTVRLQICEDYVYITLRTADDGFALYRWDARAGELETLFHGTAPIGWTSDFWVLEDGVLFGSREYADPDENPAGWEYALYRFSFENAGFELVNQFRISDSDRTNVVMSDGLLMANWAPSPGVIRVLVKDFAGQTVLDAAFDDVDWLLFPAWCLTGYGMDEDYLYFTQVGQQYIAVPRDGSGIRLLLDLGMPQDG